MDSRDASIGFATYASCSPSGGNLAVSGARADLSQLEEVLLCVRANLHRKPRQAASNYQQEFRSKFLKIANLTAAMDIDSITSRTHAPELRSGFRHACQHTRTSDRFAEAIDKQHSQCWDAVYSKHLRASNPTLIQNLEDFIALDPLLSHSTHAAME